MSHILGILIFFLVAETSVHMRIKLSWINLVGAEYFTQISLEERALLQLLHLRINRRMFKE